MFPPLAFSQDMLQQVVLCSGHVQYVITTNPINQAHTYSQLMPLIFFVFRRKMKITLLVLEEEFRLHFQQSSFSFSHPWIHSCHLNETSKSCQGQKELCAIHSLVTYSPIDEDSFVIRNMHTFDGHFQASGHPWTLSKNESER